MTTLITCKTTKDLPLNITLKPVTANSFEHAQARFAAWGGTKPEKVYLLEGVYYFPVENKLQ